VRKKVLVISIVLLSLLGAIVYLLGFFELNRTSEAVERLFLKNDKFTHNQFDYSLFQSTLYGFFRCLARLYIF
jgi:hypothetical protein